jgi:hypothetical protein
MDTTRMFLDVSRFFSLKNDKYTVENQINYLLSYDSYVYNRIHRGKWITRGEWGGGGPGHSGGALK